MNEVTLADLRKFETFEHLPDSNLQWLIDKGDLLKLEPGDLIFQVGEEVMDMKLVLTGRVRITFQQGSGEREVGVNEAPNITGILPYSRMKEATGKGTAMEETYYLSIPKALFPEMINTQAELVESLVHFMISRVRSFTSFQTQNEKLMALGKLSAGLAHELNNPASAVVRSASELKKHLKATPESFKRVISMRLSEEQVDAVNGMLFSKADLKKNANLSLMERTDLVDDVLDWLEDHDVEEADEVAEVFVEYGLGIDELDMVLDKVSDDFLSPVLGWLVNVFTTEKMVIEIQEASQRISELVQSIKSYSHMDRGVSREKFNVHHGLNSTATILNHKFRKNKVEFERDYQPDLPDIKAFGGELNQVWTNILDNALDVLEDSGGKIMVKTWSDETFVRVSITDNGPGIPEDIKNKIFDPFYSTKEIGKGTGLGLDVARKIIDRHKGKIEVTSEPGKTSFEVCLPIE